MTSKWDQGNARKAQDNIGSGSSYTPRYARASAKFSPKKAVRSFRDLEIYQKTIECSVLITKDVMPNLERQKYSYAERLMDSAMSIPLLVAESHSLRFADFALGVGYLEKAMAGCNKMIVYLEHAKGLFGSKFDMGLVDDIIGRYAESRLKMFRLEKSWKKFRTEYGDKDAGKGKGNFKY
mgnify:CR=1 FL=1